MLDYSNSMLYGINAKLVNKMQNIQNCAVQIIAKTNRKDHIIPIRFSRHWLPISIRIRLEILMVKFKCLNGLGPLYLCDLLEIYIPSRTLRIRQNTLLTKRSTSKAG